MSEGLLMRRRQVRELLGISEETMKRLVRGGVLKPRRLMSGSYAFFRRDEVLQIGLNRVK